jgi:hypothetical protein
MYAARFDKVFWSPRELRMICKALRGSGLATPPI